MDFTNLVQPVIGRIVRSPALHFLIGGALLMVIFSPLRESSELRVRVDVPQYIYEQANSEGVDSVGRPLTEQEEERLRRVVADEEVLYQEALRLGLDKSEVAQRRLAQIAQFVLATPAESQSSVAAESAVALGIDRGDRIVRRILVDLARRLIRAPGLKGEPRPELLEAYLHEHAEQYKRPAKVRLTHVTLNYAKRRKKVVADALALLDRLRSKSVLPEDAAVLGDSVPISSRLTTLPERELGRRFGPKFAKRVFALPVGTWQGPVSSRYGWHLVYVEERVPAQAPPLADVVAGVRAEVRQKLADEWLELRMREIRSGYEIYVDGRRSEASYDIDG